MLCHDIYANYFVQKKTRKKNSCLAEVKFHWLHIVSVKNNLTFNVSFSLIMRWYDGYVY